MADKFIKLAGRVFVTFDVRTLSGLHIGGAGAGIDIGGVDKTVVRNPIDGRPYIPGSSLRGKLRSLLEKQQGKVQNQRINRGYIHSCGETKPKEQGAEEYLECDICQIFGVTGDVEFATPTRLIVRDVLLSDEEAKRIDQSARTDLPYSEVKVEVAIDRVTSQANPRQIERVPAGVVFERAELAYSLYDGATCDARKDVGRLNALVTALHLLEDDYLGGAGSRGSGRVRLENISVESRIGDGLGARAVLADVADVDALAATLPAIQKQLLTALEK
jgi:CRISPR-associated protein Csm3